MTRGAEGVQPGEEKTGGEYEAGRGVTKVMEPNPSQQGAAATRVVAWEGHTGH